MDHFKKFLIFFYICILLFSFSLLNKSLEILELYPQRTMVEKNFKFFFHKPLIFLNQGTVEKILKQQYRFLKSITIERNFHENKVKIFYQYYKPVFLYQNKVVTSNGKIYQYESSLLLPTVLSPLSHGEIPLVAWFLNTYFSIKTIEWIKFDGLVWIVGLRNGQQWILMYNWSKTLNYFKKSSIGKKEITQIINEPYEKVWVCKKGLLMKKKNIAVVTQ
jgi:hypothetical protein